ncbi:MAG: UvrD/REP helicase [Bacteroidetes bacterium OLB11]|nr:MAG: UvrD/REP helicase [Bacteroidetes bacterium OLB11]
MIYGGLSFFQRKEIKDYIAYLRAIVNPQDEVALKRIINYPARNIGDISINKISLYAHENNISFWDALLQIENVGLHGASLTSVQNFVVMMKSFQALLEHKKCV